ncbi:MAG TPA: hypothetical protein VKZ67_08875 [Natronosporangium sp.]|nr:hypothetical protein [Natronosporangium sp.]
MTTAVHTAPSTTTVTAAAPLVKLRPVVHASPTSRGIHVRGWTSSFTIDGGAGLWRLWQAIEPSLVAGVPREKLGPPRARPEVAQAIELILTQLREHDLLVEVPAGWEQTGPDTPPAAVAAWLESVAADPAGAWRRLRQAQVRIIGSGPVADAATRALTDAGVTVRTEPGRQPVVLHVDAVTAVAAAATGEVGYVLPLTPVAQVRQVATQVAARLGVSADDPPPPYALAGLVGGAAAHRLICAVAGLPDPAQDAAALGADTAATLTPEHPAVLVARLDPLRASYHPWLPAAPAATAAPTGDLDAALARLDALCDPELGLVTPARPGELPQVPAALAVAGDALGIGVTGDTARLDAALQAAADALHTTVGTDVVVGVDSPHATGVALRRWVHTHLADLPNAAVAEAEWADSPAARRWWKALTLRFGVPATLRVRRLAPNLVHARVDAGGETLAWAVEATPADAVAFAALAATGLIQARRAGLDPTGPVTLTGAAPAWRPEHLDSAQWTDLRWYWPAGVADLEPRVQAAIRQLGAPTPTPLTSDTAPALLPALAAVGFVALTPAV